MPSLSPQIHRNRIISRSESSLTLRARGKINLTLKICARLESGYHLLQSLVCPISLCDDVTVEKCASGGPPRCAVEFSPELHAQLELSPEFEALNAELNSEDNIASRAAELFLARFEIRGGAGVKIIKRIPIGAGLGGGSADAAAVLLGLAQLCEVDSELSELVELGSSLGSDVPALILDRMCLVTGRGETLTALSAPEKKLGAMSAILVKPSQSVRTKDAYAALERGRLSRNHDPADFGPDSEPARSMLQDFGLRTVGYTPGGNQSGLTLLPQEGICSQPNLGSGSTIFSLFENDFQPVILRTYPELHAVEKALRAAGAERVLLAGSGSAMLGFCAGADDLLDAEKELRARARADWFITVVELDTEL